MKKHHIRFNQAQLRTEVVPFTARDYVRWILGRGLVFAGVALVAVLVFDQYFESPKVRSQKRQIAFLEPSWAPWKGKWPRCRVHSRSWSSGTKSSTGTSSELSLIRRICAIPASVVPIRYRDLRGTRTKRAGHRPQGGHRRAGAPHAGAGRERVGTGGLAENQETLLKSIPAIQPVRNNDLKRMASGYGYRIHPIYKVRKMHWGMDFSAPTGTEIFATGDGKVVEVKKKYNGYGHHIKIQHGFGYETLYAHMSKILVKRGQRVERGEVIGLVGSTGHVRGAAPALRGLQGRQARESGPLLLQRPLPGAVRNPFGGVRKRQPKLRLSGFGLNLPKGASCGTWPPSVTGPSPKWRSNSA